MKYIPRLETIEDTMKLSPMLVHALIKIKSPLLQLPHITEAHLKYFENKKVRKNYIKVQSLFYILDRNKH